MHNGIDSIATDWSRDGRYVVYMANELGTNWNIWAMPLTGDQTPQPVLRTSSTRWMVVYPRTGAGLHTCLTNLANGKCMSSDSSRLGANGKSLLVGSASVSR